MQEMIQDAQQYPCLLKPFDFGFLTLRNRMVMGAMHTRLETMDRAQERLTAFYRLRARGEAGLILTGGFAPNLAGLMEVDAPLLDATSDLTIHHAITEAVHAEGGHIALQILHAGRYAKHAHCVGPTDLRAPINSFTPRALSTEEVWSTIDDMAQTAVMAQRAGYDGIEIMGSEGYLLNTFASAQTNTRDDAFGATFEGRIKLSIETVKAVRARTGDRFLIIFRISSIDLIEGGMSGEETAEFARRLQAVGVNLLNTGIGWHEAPIPTIASSVPRAAWRFAIENIKQAVSIPVIASNRINTPEVGEQMLAAGAADFVSMARPFLADPDFARKTREGRADSINTCIGCNQACLDHIFTERVASCLVNPRAGREIEFTSDTATVQKHIAVVGGGPAGMAFAITSAERGHLVTLFEASASLGGQLNLARVVPGKSEFNELLRYFRVRLTELGVRIELNHRVSSAELHAQRFDAIIIATGVTARTPDIPGIDHPKAVSYIDVLTGRVQVGAKVAIIGTGGIGFDVAEFLLGDEQHALEPTAFLSIWGVDATLASAGGVKSASSPATPPKRQVTMLQRKTGKPGSTLGKSTGWILKANMRRAGVQTLTGVTYSKIDDHGLHCMIQGTAEILDVDHVVICAGQESQRTLADELTALGMTTHLIGGAHLATELDAARAIEQATRLAMTL
jgi:2,4-dienoyl-CoA reductase (NADPH2)